MDNERPPEMPSNMDYTPLEADPTPPASESTLIAPLEASKPKVWSFSFNGRMGRLNYINAGLIQGGCFLLAFALFALFAAAIGSANAGVIVLAFVLGVPAVIVMLILSVRLMVLRLHDLNLSGKIAIFIVILSATSNQAAQMTVTDDSISLSMAAIVLGLLNFIVFIILWAVPGTKGANKFGAQPLQGNIAGLIVMIILFVSSLIFLLWFLTEGIYYII